MNFFDVYEHYDLALLTGNAVKTQISRNKGFLMQSMKKFLISEFL